MLSNIISEGNLLQWTFKFWDDGPRCMLGWMCWGGAGFSIALNRFSALFFLCVDDNTDVESLSGESEFEVENDSDTEGGLETLISGKSLKEVGDVFAKLSASLSPAPQLHHYCGQGGLA